MIPKRPLKPKHANALPLGICNQNSFNIAACGLGVILSRHLQRTAADNDFVVRGLTYGDTSHVFGFLINHQQLYGLTFMDL